MFNLSFSSRLNDVTVKGIKEKVRITTVEVFKDDKKVLESSVRKAKNDIDNKALAKKYVLTKALKQSDFAKVDKKKIWDSFFVYSKATNKLKNK